MTYVISCDNLICIDRGDSACPRHFPQIGPQRLIYALWLVVAIRFCIPFSMFEVTFPVPVREEPAETDAEAQESAATSTFTPVILPEAQSLAPAVLPRTETGRLPEAVIEPAETEPSAAEPLETEETPVPWSRIVRVVWITGSGLMGAWFLFSGLAFLKKLHRDRRRIGTAGGIGVYISESMAAPCLAGWIPTIYLTPAAAEPKEYALVVLHEYTHFRHGDHVWNLLRTAALIVYWWNPLVWARLFCPDRTGSLPVTKPWRTVSMTSSASPMPGLLLIPFRKSGDMLSVLAVRLLRNGSLC